MLNIVGGISSSRLIVHYKSECFLYKMKNEVLASALGSNFEILTLLDYVSITLEEISKFNQEYRDVLDEYKKTHKLKMNPDFR